MKVKVKGTEIRKILAKKNMSQNWLARKLQTSSGYLSQLIRGERNPSPKMRQKMLSFLKDYQFDDLFLIKG